MATPLQVPQFFTTDFAKNWEYLAQQAEARLPKAVTPATIMGKRKWFNQLSTGSMTEVTERKGNTPDGDSTGYKYWIYRRKFEFVKKWDEDDEINLENIALPNSDEVMEFSMAENRTKDDVIIAALGATRYIGENGTDTDALPGAQQVAVNYVFSGTAVNSGITVPKLREAVRKLNAAEVPDEGRYFVHGSRQLDDLLATVETTSRDYSDLMALKDGKIKHFLGLEFIRSERMPYNSSSDYRTNYVFQKQGVKFAEMARSVRFDILPQQRHALQLRGVSRMGAVRTENERVVSIVCDESP